MHPTLRACGDGKAISNPIGDWGFSKGSIYIYIYMILYVCIYIYNGYNEIYLVVYGKFSYISYTSMSFCFAKDIRYIRMKICESSQPKVIEITGVSWSNVGIAISFAPSSIHHHLNGWDSNHQIDGWFMALRDTHIIYSGPKSRTAAG